MLCAMCISMFHRSAKQGFHHESFEHLEKAADMGCRICLSFILRREALGPDVENETNLYPFLRYKFQAVPWFPEDGRWMIRFYSNAKWVDTDHVDLFGQIQLHMSGPLQPPDWHNKLTDLAFQDLGDRPWKVRKDGSTPRIVAKNTGAVSVSAQAKEWLEKCRRTHAICRSVFKDRDNKWLPRRLIDLIQPTSPRLLQRNMDAIDGPYAAVSHCWGKDTSFLQLTQDNEASFCKEISWDCLPKSFQHSMITCHRTGLRYIWIDSLCIMQSGSNATEDWKVQAGEMRNVYLNCTVNISIDHSPGPNNGAYVERNPNFMQTCQVYSSLFRSKGKNVQFSSYRSHDPQSSALDSSSEDPDNISLMMLCNIHSFDSDNRFAREKLPLSTRAWVLQERLLSPRVLHFTKDRISWECSFTSVDEYPPTGLTGTDEAYDPFWYTPFNMQLALEKAEEPAEKANPGWNILPLLFVWSEVINSYTRRELTYPDKDKLVAFSAITDRFSNILNSAYHAGLFQCHLPASLAWVCPILKDRPALEEYRAPSWSWAKLDGEIHCNFIHWNPTKPDCFLTIESVSTVLSDTSCPFEQVIGGELRIRGTLVPLVELDFACAEIGRILNGWVAREHEESDVHFHIYFDDKIPEEQETLPKDGVLLLPIGQALDIALPPVFEGPAVISLVLKAVEKCSNTFKRIGLAATAVTFESKRLNRDEQYDTITIL
ncbi:hypothetical protein BT63DRAFT_425424 [Microthyrium microscopicum]|uniref:Heterokaryon incompatibility domain-containing protein n=1 Tax=Microthyrium microscopicum TaxID=703497 RepID=A0A6A6UEA4_9PEZI|nr:hypothetical protein BT63DRAFT_425424 [Microthyrium microscopicum]